MQTAPLVLSALALSMLPGVALAQPCYEESAVDQRQLTELRQAVDDVCPCSSFDSARAYGRCADDVLEQALASGDLRPECKAQAVGILETATCGTRGVACARIAPASTPAFTCSIKSESSCRGQSGGTRLLAARPPGIGTDGPIRVRRPRRSVTGGYAETVCAEQTHCADVLDWTGGTCFDVREDGPYEPGVRTMTITKPSAVDGEPRELELVIWYPAPPDAGPRDEAERAILDAPVDASGGPYPIVLFSHGSCGYPRQSLFLTPWLATHGYVVVAPPHPGNTIFEIATCSGAPGSATERPADMIAALDAILAENADASSPFAGMLDEDAIAMTGHSFGGFTTFRVAEDDDRITAAIPMAAAAPAGFRLDVPSLALIGDVDSVVDNDGNVAAYRLSARPKWLVNIRHTGHYAFSDGCFPGPDCDPPLVLTQAEAGPRVRRWVLPFLKVFLDGDLSFAPFLAEEAGPSFDVDAG